MIKLSSLNTFQVTKAQIHTTNQTQPNKNITNEPTTSNLHLRLVCAQQEIK